VEALNLPIRARLPRGHSYCGQHRPIRRSAKLRGGRATIAKFRADCLRLSGCRCDTIVDGVRCSVTDPAQLEAHHVRAVSTGGSNVAAENGALLCVEHHRVIARGA
jgi:hypothetical protein